MVLEKNINSYSSFFFKFSLNFSPKRLPTKSLTTLINIFLELLISPFEYSKPVLCAVNQETDIGTIVEEEGCGLSVDHGDLDAFVEAVKYMSEQGEKRDRWGQNGRKLLMESYTVSHSYKIIINRFNRQPADQ